ncbi:pilus assembly protein [Noviherbaspirillum cavernae]|uniref:Pilus assembly protein n=1 Tax=Noviherbaspirillum cavernae TaxID=2320862 RepID=A0A418X2B5_9BURK|nr:PilX N-terminal domain-containing pilus assembly protein [Noviherbaspirillum cavernae]RJG06599.1 pilus assembly protein [Noviherbaspirillum cavernae]
MTSVWQTSGAISRKRRCASQPSRQVGASLIVSLLMLIVILLLGISAASLALQSEKASRNDRDRQIAFQAAEAGLMDAERDIERSPDPGKSRSHLFANDSAEGFVPGCGNSGTNLGLCSPAHNASPQIWQTVDFMDQSANAHTVPYGQFTGQIFRTGKGVLPSRPPRYIIEFMSDTRPGASASAEDMAFIYRITAIGFGMRESTQVVLQSIYRKDAQ